MTVAHPYIMIAGPTASGKSQLAIDLAKQCGGAVINADSMQLYADLSILTARPQPHEMQDIPHHLFGVFDAAHRASVAEWLDHAATAYRVGAGVRTIADYHWRHRHVFTGWSAWYCTSAGCAAGDASAMCGSV
jgi:tRNA A37 N6-isopentenylltransferase MiaA